MPVHFGSAVITVDGVELPTIAGSAKIKLGGDKGNIRMGPRGPVGATITPEASEVTCDLSITDDWPEEKIRAVKEVQIQFTDVNTGAGWVVPRAWKTEDGELTEGEDAKMSVTYQGTKAQRAK